MWPGTSLADVTQCIVSRISEETHGHRLGKLTVGAHLGPTATASEGLQLAHIWGLLDCPWRLTAASIPERDCTATPHNISTKAHLAENQDHRFLGIMSLPLRE